MNLPFQRLLGDATRLTRSGDLHAATAAIQAALRGLSGETPPARSTDDADWVIDLPAGDVREVPSFESMAVPSAPPHAADATDTACAKTATPAAGRFVHGSHADTAGTREYKLFIPPNPSDRALPLVVMLHGCTQNPDDFAAGTGMNDAALAQGFFVLYPAQAQQANAQRCWNWFKHTHQQRDRGEPALLAGMVRSVMRQHRIDPRRVYVAGLSAGGAMAAILGDAYPDLFAAVGVHSGLATGSANDVGSAFAAMKSGDGTVAAKTGLAQLHGMHHGAAVNVRPRPARRSNAPPTIVFHGDRDNTVHPANGERVVAASMEPGQDGSRPATPKSQQQRDRSPNGRHYTRTVHRDDNGRTLSEHWVVHGAGHAWSGGRAAGSYTDPQGPDATAEMLRFFLSVG